MRSVDSWWRHWERSERAFLRSCGDARVAELLGEEEGDDEEEGEESDRILNSSGFCAFANSRQDIPSGVTDGTFVANVRPTHAFS